MECEIVAIRYEIRQLSPLSASVGYVDWENSDKKWWWEKTSYPGGRSRPIFNTPEEALENFKEYVKGLGE